MDPQIVTPWWEDKAVRMVLIFIVTMIANAFGRKFGIQLNPEEIVTIAIAVIGFIGAHKWKTAMLTKTQILADASALVGQAAANDTTPGAGGVPANSALRPTNT